MGSGITGLDLDGFLEQVIRFSGILTSDAASPVILQPLQNEIVSGEILRP